MSQILIAGVDEAGRGPLAGPVAAAAVILDPNRPILGLKDSKLLTESERSRLFDEIFKNALAVGIGLAEPFEIDALNILQATLLAMRRAILTLALKPNQVWIDGNRLPNDLPCPGRAIIQGDKLEPCIGAASIIAKVTRDRIMQRYDEVYAYYGFSKHKGYPTKQHLEALAIHGPCWLHRRSFTPVKNAIKEFV